MAYASRNDITTLYSEDALYVADRDGDGVADASAIARALTSASSEIDSFLGVRYALPLPVQEGEAAHELLTQFCVDIAIYRLALSRDVLSEEHRRRYEDTLKHLQKIADGKATLNLAGPVDPATGEAASNTPRPIVASGPEREFTRAKMRGL